LKLTATAIVAGLSLCITAFPAQGDAPEPPARPVEAAPPAVDAPSAAAKPAPVAPAVIPVQVAQPAKEPPAPAPVPPVAKPVAQPAIARIAIAKRSSSKAQRDAQRNSLKSMPDGGSFKMSDIVRFALVDGRLKAEWVGNFPAGQGRRIKIEGSDATYMVNQFNQAPNSVYTLARYDFDAPEDEIWSISMTVQQAQSTVSLYAQGGDTCEVMRLNFTQQVGRVVMGVTGWDNNRARQILNANAADLFTLRSDYPDEVRRYLAPILRKVTGQPLLQPGASDVYKVFIQIPADPKITSRIEALLPDMISSESTHREKAAAQLFKLGAPGALGALRYDASLLAPEQQSRLDDLVMAHSRMIIEDPAAALQDADFLLDCVESDDLKIRALAKEALEKLLGRKVNIDPDADGKKREQAVDALRKQLAKARKVEEKKPADPNAPPQPAVGPQILPARGNAAGGIIIR